MPICNTHLKCKYEMSVQAFSAQHLLAFVHWRSAALPATLMDRNKHQRHSPPGWGHAGIIQKSVATKQNSVESTI
jgi:hypothetical protein